MSNDMENEMAIVNRYVMYHYHANKDTYFVVNMIWCNMWKLKKNFTKG